MKIKNKSRLLIGILTLGTVVGFLALSVGFTRANEYFIVIPSGGDDTENIQNAFDAAVAAGPGSTVLLMGEQFYTNAIYVENFHGTFKGIGKGFTKIDVVRGVDPTDPGVSGPDGPYLFTFAGGDVCISGLSFDITPDMPAAPWEDLDEPSYDLVSIILITGETNSRINNIKIIGHEGTLLHPIPGISYNVRVGVEYHFGTGKHTITKCVFDSIWGGISAYGLMDVEMRIMSNSFKGGTFGIINMDNSNSKFEITCNYIETSLIYGIWAWQVGFVAPPSPCQWRVTRNTIRVSGFADGIGLQDHVESIHAVVSRNKIILDDTMCGGIWTFGLLDASIINNYIRGTGDYGIECVSTNNSQILGNIISNSQNNGINFDQSSQNLLLGNWILKNGGWGLYMEGSNDNSIIGNLFYKNTLGNIYDDGSNEYKWNWLF
ncbi:MAG: NosD domain-containing protein [Candidatus Thorarchaeota archaeon]